MSSTSPWLPFDYSRCVGAKEFLQCDNCMRKLSPGREVWQSFIAVVPSKDGTCEYKISVKLWEER